MSLPLQVPTRARSIFARRRLRRQCRDRLREPAHTRWPIERHHRYRAFWLAMRYAVDYPTLAKLCCAVFVVQDWHLPSELQMLESLAGSILSLPRRRIFFEDRLNCQVNSGYTFCYSFPTRLVPTPIAWHQDTTVSRRESVPSIRPSSLSENETRARPVVFHCQWKRRRSAKEVNLGDK